VQQQPVQQPPVQQQPVQQPPRTVAGVTEEAPADQGRRQVVAGASEEAVESVAERPQAVLPAAGMSEVLTWLMLALASMLITVGFGIRAWQLRRN
jgi:hypothetical protein